MLKKILQLIGDATPKLSDSHNANCVVCGGLCNDGAIEFKKLFSASSFNLNHEFKNMGGSHVCSYCAVFFSVENWRLYCERNNQDPYFPEVKDKKRSLANWVFFSHYFAKDKHVIMNNRQDWRQYLINPPEPPFCFVISTMCKKHLIFKAEMAYNRDYYPIRFEDKIVYIDVPVFKTCLEHFEALYALGLNKASVRSGDYNSSALLKVDKSMFWQHENALKPLRLSHADYLAICEFVAGKDVS